jgi:hypothetical protein
MNSEYPSSIVIIFLHAYILNVNIPYFAYILNINIPYFRYVTGVLENRVSPQVR